MEALDRNVALGVRGLRERNPRHDQRDEKERYLLEQELRGRWPRADPERIQEEQNDGERDRDRLREHGEDEERERGPIPPCAAPLLPGRGVELVGQDSGQEEKGAEEVLSVRDPGHGFGAQRVQREEKAREERAHDR